MWLPQKQCRIKTELLSHLISYTKMETRCILFMLPFCLTISEDLHLTIVTVLRPGTNFPCKMEYCNRLTKLFCITAHYDAQSFMIGYNGTHSLSCFLHGDQNITDISNFNEYFFIRAGKRAKISPQ